MSPTHRRYHPRRLAYMATSLLGVAAAAAGCAAGGLDESSAYRGDAGPVNWEIVGIRTNTDVLHRFTIGIDGGAQRLTLERKP